MKSVSRIPKGKGFFIVTVVIALLVIFLESTKITSLLLLSWGLASVIVFWYLRLRVDTQEPKEMKFFTPSICIVLFWFLLFLYKDVDMVYLSVIPIFTWAVYWVSMADWKRTVAVVFVSASTSFFTLSMLFVWSEIDRVYAVSCMFLFFSQTLFAVISPSRRDSVPTF